MKNLGGTLVLFGVGSFVLNFIGYEFSLLMWIDNWGTGVGVMIRLAMIVVGAALWYIGMKQESSEVAHSEPQTEYHPEAHQEPHPHSEPHPEP